MLMIFLIIPGLFIAHRIGVEFVALLSSIYWQGLEVGRFLGGVCTAGDHWEGLLGGICRGLFSPKLPWAFSSDLYFLCILVGKSDVDDAGQPELLSYPEGFGNALFTHHGNATLDQWACLN